MTRTPVLDRALSAALVLAAVATLAAAVSDALAAVIGLATVVLLLVGAQAAVRALSRRRSGRDGERRVRERRAVDTAELARRRVAAQLRDRVLEDLAGVGYALSHPAQPGADPARLAAVVQDTIRTLRQVLLDVQPPALSGDTLGPALEDLTAGLRLAGVRCAVRVPAGLPLTPATAGLLHRAAREALRERSESLVSAREALQAVDQAAGSAPVDLTAAASGGTVSLTVTGGAADPAADALHLLAADLAEAGGALTVSGDGSRVTATVPAAESGR